jgi:hypothetical protein
MQGLLVMKMHYGEYDSTEVRRSSRGRRVSSNHDRELRRGVSSKLNALPVPYFLAVVSS